MFPENLDGKLAMMTDSWRNHEIHYAVVFLITVISLLGTSYWITGINKAPYPEPVNLGAFATDEFVVTNRLDERYRAGLKIRSVERFGMPAVAAFGSHAIKYMTSESLGIAPDGFFNFYVMHIGLPGISTLLRKLESSGSFPQDLILVQLHNPHTSNWTHISTLVWDLPLRFYLIHSGMKVTDRIRFSLRRLGAFLRDRLNYRIVLHELIYGSVFGCVPAYGIRRVGHVEKPRSAKPKSAAAIIKALGIDRGPDRVFQNSCTRLGGYRHDGSFVQDQAAVDMAPPRRRVTLVKEETPIGGATRIASLMREIERISRRNGAKAIFFVPPIFESDRTSENARVLSRAIRDAGMGLTVLDHRTRYRSPEYFINHGEAYFKALAGELRQMGILDGRK